MSKILKLPGELLNTGTPADFLERLRDLEDAFTLVSQDRTIIPDDRGMPLTYFDASIGVEWTAYYWFPPIGGNPSNPYLDLTSTKLPTRPWQTTAFLTVYQIYLFFRAATDKDQFTWAPPS